jgi:hypothetical protein
MPSLDIIMVVDESETMWNQTDREGVRVNTVNYVIDMLSAERSGSVHRLGIVAFGTEPHVIPYTLLDSQAAAEKLKEQYAAVHKEIESQKDHQYTDVNQALRAALEMIELQGDPERKATIILISDAQPTTPEVSEGKGEDTVVAYLNETRRLLRPLSAHAYVDNTCPSTQGVPFYMVGIGVEKLAESSTPDFIALYRGFWQEIAAKTGGYYREASRLEEMQSTSTYVFSELLCVPATPPLVVHSPQVLEYQVYDSYFQIFFNISGKEHPEVEAKIYRPQRDGAAGGGPLSKNEEGVSWQSNNIDYEVWAVTYTEPWAGTWQVILEEEGRAEFSYVIFPDTTIHLHEPSGAFLPADEPVAILASIVDDKGEPIDVPAKDFQVAMEGEDGFREQLSLEKTGNSFGAQLKAPGKTGEYSLILHALLPDGTPLYEHKWLTFISAPWVEMTEPTWGSSHMLGESIPLQARVHLAGGTSVENVRLIATLSNGDQSIQTVEMGRDETVTQMEPNVAACSGSFRPVEEIGEYVVQVEMMAVLPGGRVYNHQTVPLPLAVVAPPTSTPSPSPAPPPTPTSTPTPTPSPTPTRTPTPAPIVTASPTSALVRLLAPLTGSPYCLPGVLALLFVALLLALLALLRRKRRQRVPEKIELLAELTRSRQDSDELPYVLVLGSGPSVTLGSNSMKHVVKAIAGSHDLQKFYETLDGLSLLERYTILKKHLNGASVSPGYRRLADLVKKGFFDLIFTTNLDPFLENALTQGKFKSTDFEVFVCGEQSSAEIIGSLENAQPRVKIVKLHGDVLSRSFAFTPSEISLFGSQSEYVLRRHLNRDLIIVGLGPRDYDINRAIRQEGGSIWYVNQSPPAATDVVFQVMRGRGTQSNVISGEFGLFDRFLETLHRELTRR